MTDSVRIYSGCSVEKNITAEPATLLRTAAFIQRETAPGIEVLRRGIVCGDAQINFTATGLPRGRAQKFKSCRADAASLKLGADHKFLYHQLAALQFVAAQVSGDAPVSQDNECPWIPGYFVPDGRELEVDILVLLLRDRDPRKKLHVFQRGIYQRNIHVITSFVRIISGGMTQTVIMCRRQDKRLMAALWWVYEDAGRAGERGATSWMQSIAPSFFGALGKQLRIYRPWSWSS